MCLPCTTAIVPRFSWYPSGVRMNHHSKPAYFPWEAVCEVRTILYSAEMTEMVCLLQCSRGKCCRARMDRHTIHPVQLCVLQCVQAVPFLLHAINGVPTGQI